MIDDVLFYEDLAESLESAVADMGSWPPMRRVSDPVTNYSVNARDMQLMLMGAEFLAKHVARYLVGADQRPDEGTAPETWCMRGCLREHEELAYGAALLRDSDMAEAIISIARDDLDAILRDLGKLKDAMAAASCGPELMAMVAGAERNLSIVAGDVATAVGELNGDRANTMADALGNDHEPTP